MDSIAYFADNGSGVVQAVNYDGTGSTDLFSIRTGGDSLQMALSEATNTLFVYTAVSEDGISLLPLIQSFNLDTSEVTTLHTGFITNDLFVDELTNQLYWTSVSSVYRSDFDGANLEQIFTIDGSPPFSVAIGPNITAVPVSVPEPGTLGLLVSVFLTLVALRCSRAI